MGDSAMRQHIDASMRDLISETLSPTRDEFKQHLRLRRFMLASIFSVLYLLVLAIFYTQDKVDSKTLFEACAIVAAEALDDSRFPSCMYFGWRSPPHALREPPDR